MSVLSLRGRLDRLEKQAGIIADPGLFIVVKAQSEGAVETALLEQGIDPHDPRHRIVHIKQFIVDPDGTATIYQCKPEVSATRSVDLSGPR